MDFSFSEQHIAVRDTVRRLCQSEHQQLVAAAEENEALPRDVFTRWGELGLLGVRYPESDGGSGPDKISDCIVREELSYMSQGFASSWSAHSTPGSGRSGRHEIAQLGLVATDLHRTGGNSIVELGLPQDDVVQCLPRQGYRRAGDVHLLVCRMVQHAILQIDEVAAVLAGRAARR